MHCLWTHCVAIGIPYYATVLMMMAYLLHTSGEISNNCNTIFYVYTPAWGRVQLFIYGYANEAKIVMGEEYTYVYVYIYMCA